jgi:hypothetical protein
MLSSSVRRLKDRVRGSIEAWVVDEAQRPHQQLERRLSNTWCHYWRASHEVPAVNSPQSDVHGVVSIVSRVLSSVHSAARINDRQISDRFRVNIIDQHLVVWRVERRCRDFDPEVLDTCEAGANIIRIHRAAAFVKVAATIGQRPALTLGHRITSRVPMPRTRAPKVVCLCVRNINVNKTSRRGRQLRVRAWLRRWRRAAHAPRGAGRRVGVA